MTKDKPDATSAAILQSAKLRVVFYREGDRFAHRVEVFDVDRDDWIAAFESIEGSLDDIWPPSPAFQQLHIEERPTGRVVLLIGMAGRSHWSAAVDLTTDGAVRFDVAARVKTSDARLGSTYRAVNRTGAPSVGPVPRFVVESHSSARSEESKTAEGSPAEVVTVRPQSAAVTIPATIIWQYAIAPPIVEIGRP